MITVLVDTKEEFDELHPVLDGQRHDYQVNYREGSRPDLDPNDTESEGLCIGYGRVTHKGAANGVESKIRATA